MAIGIMANIMDKESTLLQLAHHQQKHAHLLFACGHKLALDKCSYYLVDCIRDGFRHQCKMIHELDGELQLQEGFNRKPKLSNVYNLLKVTEPLDHIYLLMATKGAKFNIYAIRLKTGV